MINDKNNIGNTNSFTRTADDDDDDVACSSFDNDDV